MDKEKTSKETPTQKKSASGIWEWILWILFLVLPVAVFVGVFGNTIWYALTGNPSPITAPEVAIATQVPEEEWYCSLCDKKFAGFHNCYFCEFHKKRHIQSISYGRISSQDLREAEYRRWKISDKCYAICTQCSCDFTDQIDCTREYHGMVRGGAMDFSKCDQCSMF